MKFLQIMAVAAVAMFTAALAITPAEARKRHHRHHHVDRVQVTKLTPYTHCISDDRYPHNCGVRQEQPSRRPTRMAAIPSEVGFTNNALVNEARKYIGTNPTGRGSLWCGAFMDLVLKRTGHKGGGNLASGYARYGTRIHGPQVGAIAVMSREGGGHVGVVSGIDPNGNPIVISGNTRAGKGPHTTLEHAYPRSRVYAYVLPQS